MLWKIVFITRAQQPVSYPPSSLMRLAVRRSENSGIGIGIGVKAGWSIET
jgi:hypothetical protein